MARKDIKNEVKNRKEAKKLKKENKGNNERNKNKQKQGRRIEFNKSEHSNIEIVLIGMVILTMIRQFFLGNFDNVFLGGLTLVLFLIPGFLEHELNMKIPMVLRSIILIFIFSAEILGEINAFYIKIPIWDTMLHTINGFLMAAIGFALIDIFNRSEKFSLKMSPYFVGFVAFCFSMTIGVLWEFFEFGMDTFMGMDMQKDWVVNSINSVMLNPNNANVPVRISGVEEVIVNGKELGVGGYLDIGLIDTMKDLIVNFIGAVTFSIIGIIYLKNQGKGKFAASFIPTVNDLESSSVSAIQSDLEDGVVRKEVECQSDLEDGVVRKKEDCGKI